MFGYGCAEMGGATAATRSESIGYRRGKVRQACSHLMALAARHRAGAPAGVRTRAFDLGDRVGPVVAAFIADGAGWLPGLKRHLAERSSAERGDSMVRRGA